jgi:iron complex outermembrane receptor protein
MLATETYENIGSGTFVGSEPLTRSSDDVVTYLANARYHFSQHAVGYLRYATGYRPGGPNFVVINQNTGLPYQPLTFQPDSLKSYEAGFKTETADGRFSIDVDGYYIDWNNIQVSTAEGNVGFLTNAPGGANILGSELTATAQPISALKITGAFAYQHAYLREADPGLGASAGERLPEVPRFTAALNGDYVIQEEGLRPTVGTTLRYVSDRTASFDGSPRPQYRLPAYTAVDLRSGIAIDRVNVQLYVRNLFDERGQLSALYTNVGTARVAILQPRTIGVTLSTKF